MCCGMLPRYHQILAQPPAPRLICHTAAIRVWHRVASAGLVGCASASEKVGWPWLELAKTESSHHLFAPHDSRQKLCPVTNHTHAHTHTDHSGEAPGSTEKHTFVWGYPKMAKLINACVKNEAQICVREVLACGRAAAGHVFRRAHWWHA